MVFYLFTVISGLFWIKYLYSNINEWSKSKKIWSKNEWQIKGWIKIKLGELFKKKNADYGDAFAEFGVIGVLMRIEDKIKRSLSITKNGITLVDDEKIRDTLIDLHNYAAMAIMLLDENIPTLVPTDSTQTPSSQAY